MPDHRRLHHPAAGSRRSRRRRASTTCPPRAAPASSVITATLRLNYDSNRALTEINTQVASVRNQLPPQAQQPVTHGGRSARHVDAMYLGYFSDTIPPNSVTDYLLRVVQAEARFHRRRADRRDARRPRLFALRAWLDPQRMAAHGVAADDVYAALGANNYLAAVGSDQGSDGDRRSDGQHRRRIRWMSSATWWSSSRTTRWCGSRMSPTSCWAPRTTISTSPSAASARCSSASRWRRKRQRARCGRSGCAPRCPTSRRSCQPV